MLQLVQDGLLDLDRPMAGTLKQPLPAYGKRPGYANWSDLAGDERWRQLTPRMLLTHSGGFANFAFLEPDGQLRFHFMPGQRCAYSGEGLMLLQFVLEHGLGLDVGQEMQRRLFQPLGMARTSLRWRDDFATNLADGWTQQGAVVAHSRRGRVRAAGSMDTTLADMAAYAAAHVRGAGLAPRHATELTRPQRPITTASQFPTLQPELPPAQRRADLAAGLGLVTFVGPQGAGYYKGGHDDQTSNTLVCLQQAQRCVLILANDVRAERAFPRLVALVLGEAGVPWGWEYPGMDFLP